MYSSYFNTAKLELQHACHHLQNGTHQLRFFLIDADYLQQRFDVYLPGNESTIARSGLALSSLTTSLAVVVEALWKKIL